MLSNQGTANIEGRTKSSETVKTPANQGTANIEVHTKSSETPANQGTAENDVYLYSINSLKDYKEFKDQGEDSIFNAALNPSKNNEDNEKDQIQFYVETSLRLIFYK